MKKYNRKLILGLIIFTVLVLILIGCSDQNNKMPKYTVTCLPLKFILMEIIGNEEDIAVLVDAGYSPHTYTPPPSVMKKMENSEIIFYIEENFDKWAIKESYKNLTGIFRLLPESFVLRFSENEVDPHFWTDPLAVKTIVPDLTQILIEKEPLKAEEYKENANKFMDKLSQLDRKINDILEPVKGCEVYLFHPSFNYMLKRYGLVYAGSIEESPGKEPSPKFISDLISRIKKSESKAIFSEPQLSENSIQAIAESSGLNIYILDPLGGIEDRKNYFNLMLYNAQVLQKALSN